MKRMLMIFTVTNAIIAFCSDLKPEGGPYKETKDGIDWLFVVDSKLHANVSSGDWLSPAISRKTKGPITIPSVLGGRDVSSIGDYAFYGCDYLTSASIPPSVTSIGECAFYGCNGLEIVTLSTNLQYIGYGAFCYCPLTNVTIPPSVTNICALAFNYCTSLTEITIPPGVTQIDVSTFGNCTSMTNVTIPIGVKSIGRWAFENCCSMEDLQIPVTVTNIDSDAFLKCSSLKGITIPCGVKRIGEDAFKECDSMNWIDFEGTPPEGLAKAKIKQEAFIRYNVEYEDEWLPVIQECGFTNATAYAVPKPDGGPYTESVGETEWTFMVSGGKASVTTANLATGAVTIPSMLGGRSVTSIGDLAFRECSELTSVTIPASVTTIGLRAFEKCGKLADVYFEGDALSSIGEYAFSGCYWDLIMHVPETWQGRGRTICGYTILKGCIFIIK